MLFSDDDLNRLYFLEKLLVHLSEIVMLQRLVKGVDSKDSNQNCQHIDFVCAQILWHCKDDESKRTDELERKIQHRYF